MGSSTSSPFLTWDKLEEAPVSPSVDEIPQVVSDLKKNFATGETKTYAWRIKQLRAMEKMIMESEALIVEAAARDLHRPPTETVGFELGFTLDECRKAQRELKTWMTPEKHSLPVTLKFDGDCRTYPEPKGTILVISPWNGAWVLSITPLIGVIAAGNCALLKPSEISPNMSRILAIQIPKYLDTRAIKVVEGDATIGSALLKEEWNHIVFTGGGKIAKFVAKAAAEFLTPLTLELGGKCPCFVDDTANIPVAANRIIWGKCLNAGQVCMCVDYILVTPKVQDQLIQHMKEAVKKFYGENPKESKDYSRIISKNHFLRIKTLVDPVKENIIFGGDMDEDDKYISPTFILNPPLDSAILQEEIFGPVCPIFPVKDVKEAVDFIKARKEKPLFTYMFSSNNTDIEYYIDNLSSGQVAINEVMLNYSVIDAPFGGVGASGMGAYRGKNSFNEFSHKKSVLKRKTWLDLDVRYPPYDENKFKKTEKLAVYEKLF